MKQDPEVKNVKVKEVDAKGLIPLSWIVTLVLTVVLYLGLVALLYQLSGDFYA